VVRRELRQATARTLIDTGVGTAMDRTCIKDPVVGFIFGQKGLMYDLTLEGSRFTRLDRK
jgi:hypothetical protein